LPSALDGGEWSASRPDRGKNLRYPLDRRLGGPQSRSRHCGEDTNLDTTVTRVLVTLKHSFATMTGALSMVRVSLMSSEALAAMSLGVATHQRSDIPSPY
jgi:hypothetical protein